MRIGIDARMYSSAFTGIGRYVLELINHLFAIDQINEYTIFFNEPHFSQFHLKRKGVKKVLVGSPHYSFSEQTRFLRKLWANNLDLMHFTHFNAPVFYRKPCIVTIHDLTLSFYPGKKMTVWWRRLGYQFVIRSIVNRAKKIIAVSEHTKKDLVKLFKLNPEKIEVIHEGVNPSFHQIQDKHLLDEFRKKLDIEKPFFLYTGNWRDHKNLVSLIKAFSILKKKYRLPHFLVITGKEDPWYPEVKQAVINESLEGEVRFTGLIPDENLVLLYNCADLYVFPSLYEGFGLPALESFACGLPVVAANKSSLPEICGDAALYFDPHNIEDIAEKIFSACNDEIKKEDLRRRGFLRMKNFSWEEMAKKTLEIYNEAEPRK